MGRCQQICLYSVARRIDIPENDEERQWLEKQNFRNTVEDAYTG